MGVLKDLANILNIAPPTGYQIIERTTTPPSQKLGLYRIKGKDGKEGGKVFLQSFLKIKSALNKQKIVINKILISCSTY